MAAGDRPVLVVEDDLDLLDMVALVLEGEGYRVMRAEEGGEALDEVEQEMPGVILLDMKMPGMNGWEFARSFRARHDREAPIVVLTAAEDALRRAQEIDAEDHLGKPFEIDDLIAKVGRYLPPPGP